MSPSTLYFISVLVHILAAVVWVGGQLFLVLVTVPALRHHPSRGEILQKTGILFRRVGWTALILLLLTGTWQAWTRGLLTPPTSPYHILALHKLALIVLIMLLTALHDWWLGPLSARKVQWAQRWSRLTAQITLLLSIVMIVLGMMLSRGIPR